MIEKLTEVFVNNLTRAVAAAHNHYISGTDTETCDQVRHLEIFDMCQFSKNTPACHELDKYFDYADFVFCKLVKKESDFIIVHLFITALTLLYVTMLTVVTVTIFAPNILAVSNYCKFSEHSSGVIFVSLATSFPDVISNITAKHVDSELFVNELQGSALYLRTFISGILLICSPSSLCAAFYKRDEVFYFMGLVAVAMMFLKEEVHMNHGILTMIVYCTYAVVVFIQEFYMQTKMKLLKKMILRMLEYERVAQLQDKAHENAQEKKRAVHEEAIANVKAQLNAYLAVYDTIKPIDYRINTLNAFPVGSHPNAYIFQQMLQSLDPRKTRERLMSKKWERIVLTIGFPIHLLFSLLVPVVNTKLPLQGWSKLLNFLNIIISPLIFMHAYQLHTYACLILYIPICGFAMFSFYTTRTDTPPKYHIFYAFLGTFMSCLVVDKFARELVSLWAVWGFIFAFSKGTIGNLLLSVANTIPDIVLSLTLAGMGYPRMSYVSLINRPIIHFNFVIGLVVFKSALHSENKTVNLRSGSIGTTGMVFLIIEFFATLNITILLNYHLRRSMGVFSVCIYLLFVLYISLAEIGFVHAYGTDHAQDENTQHKTADWA